MALKATTEKPIERRFALIGGVDPLQTISMLWQGPGDPQMRIETGSVMRATRTAAGPASLYLRPTRTELLATAWGAGAEAALDAVPGMIGLLDDPSPFVAQHTVVAELARRLPGIRLARGGRVLEALVPSILAQKITGLEAHQQHRALLARFGERAPGPLGLMVPPTPESLARLPYWAFHPLGVERRRADTIRAAAAVAPRLEALSGTDHETGMTRLMSLPGVGAWTAAETLRLALGDPDAVSVGDYHLPHLVCAALANEPDGDDARMLELLEPYRGQRARVALLIEHGAVWGKRRVPRRRLRSIATI